MKTIRFATIATLLFSIGLSHSAPAEDFARREKEFKGVELYARFEKDRNQWRFGLLSGTNRSKQAADVNQSMTLTGLDALLAEMKRLAPREEVFLVSPGRNDAEVTPLDEETRKKLVEFCAKNEIILNGDGIGLQQPNRTIAAMEASADRRELIVSQTQIDGKGLAMIAEKFPALESLELSYCGITDDDLSPLGELKSLRSLEMNDNYDMTGNTFGFVADLKKLRRINLTNCTRLTDDAVAAISKSPSVESLNLDSCRNLTAACAPHLGAMTGIKDLNLAGVGLSDAAIRELVGIKALVSLDIAVSKVTDEGLAAVATLPNLKRLGLRACRNHVTLDGIKALAPLRLEYLDVNLTGRDDAPVNEKEILQFAKETWPGSEIVVTNGVSHYN